MVVIEEVSEDATVKEHAGGGEEEIPPSKERYLDAEEIEAAAATMKRPRAKLHLEQLATKLRKEAEALERVERSKAKTKTVAEEEEGVQQSEPTATSAAATTAQAAPTSAAAVPPVPKTSPAAPLPSSHLKYAPIDRFSFDAGGYNSQFVTVYVPLPGVGSIARENVACTFTSSSFDLVVNDLDGRSYRLFKDNLEKDIVAEKCKKIVKADKVVVKLAKVKSEYGSYDFWSKLVDNKKRPAGKNGAREKDDPQKSIMQMMKDMYDDGDDNMRKTIGEAMMKQRNGELDGPNRKSGLDGFGDDD